MRYQQTNPFYLSGEWRRLRRAVLEADKYECQDHKAQGYYERADTVHHVKPIDRYPELRLKTHYLAANGITQRNLISLCHGCHEKRHGYRAALIKPLTQERW